MFDTLMQDFIVAACTNARRAIFEVYDNGHMFGRPGLDDTALQILDIIDEFITSVINSHH
jgi:hypothetical protein